ncbi:hypothetical protein M501DRAFT_144202 [Patellaria atrata CBS 101060]|uniref:Uncharacterized protein n=1 Tax=Patellaria atrata CBS 101060 TaxID=1346257 RepID=A0A9P4VRU0_9PEZI|nr:hypothetical protein M501DRAFT_144202 [Patellaria atrata CBS 101060]
MIFMLWAAAGAPAQSHRSRCFQGYLGIPWSFCIRWIRKCIFKLRVSVELKSSNVICALIGYITTKAVGRTLVEGKVEVNLGCPLFREHLFVAYPSSSFYDFPLLRAL